VSTLPPPISTASASDLLLPPQPYVVVVLGVHDSIKADFRVCKPLLELLDFTVPTPP
jgi:hypothetical protein